MLLYAAGPRKLPASVSGVLRFDKIKSGGRTTTIIRREEPDVSLAKKQPGADEDQHGGEDDSEGFTGYTRGEMAADQDARDTPQEQRRSQPQIHVALRGMGNAGDERKHGGVDDIRADHDRRRQGVEQEQYDRHDAPRAYRGETYKVAPGRAEDDSVDLASERHGGDTVPTPALAGRLAAHRQEDAKDQGHPGQH